jgi:acid stress-induced BolA-like protein IbaG/YrbA
MALNTLSESGGSSVSTLIHDAIVAALPGAQVRVTARQPGHFEIDVTCEAFRGQSRLSCQRLVYRSIAPLMSGDRAPVHAVDHLETRTP